jgi:peptidoglycan biosynthesis protein MviN/MurJ (putative lipid II flippase)
MIKLAAGMTIGLLFGVVMAAVVAPYAGMNGFSGHAPAVALGYACSACVGCAMGLLAERQTGFGDRKARVVTACAVAVLATYVLRSLPLPWLNLVWLDGTAGPLAELPLVVLPAVGLMLGGMFGGARAERREARYPRT